MMNKVSILNKKIFYIYVQKDLTNFINLDKKSLYEGGDN